MLKVDAHDVEEEEGIVKVGILASVLDDFGLNNVPANLKLNGRGSDTGQLELAHVTHTPTHHL